jgi:hypothetical protein
MLTELTHQTVETFVAAQKALLDLMVKSEKPNEPAPPKRPHRARRHPVATPV